METAKSFIENIFFPGWAGPRRRQRQFLLVAVVLGVFLAIAFGACLYILNRQGRI
jgi:hypothetical protein